jgi:hypothetical protein
VDRSLRRFGQLLIVTGALLGAVLGVALALIVNNAATSGAVATSGRKVRPRRPPARRVADPLSPERLVPRILQLGALPAATSAPSGRAEPTGMMARPITTVKAASARLRAAATTSPKDKADGTGKGKGKFYDGQPLQPIA